MRVNLVILMLCLLTMFKGHGNEKWLVYSSDKNGSQDVYIHDINTGKTTQLTMFEGDVYFPTMSPNKQFAVAEGQVKSGNSDVVLFDNEGQSRRLTQYKGWDAYPMMHPTQDKVLFTSARDKYAGLYVKDLVSHKLEAITANNIDSYFGRWHKNGRDVMYHTRAGLGHEFPLDIVVKNLNTGEVSPLVAWQGNEKYANWSNDYTQVVFESDKYGKGDLFIKNLESGEISRVTYTKEKERHASFSQSGGKLVYIVDFGKHNEVFIKDLATGKSIQVTFDKASVWHPYFVSDKEYESFYFHWVQTISNDIND